MPGTISLTKLKRGKTRRSRILAKDDKAENETGKSPQKPVSNPDEETQSSAENESSSKSSSSDQLVNLIDNPANPDEEMSISVENESSSNSSSSDQLVNMMDNRANPDEEMPISGENESSSNSSSSDQLDNPIDKLANPDERIEYQPECEDVSRISSPIEPEIPTPVQDLVNEALQVENEASLENSNDSEMLKDRDSIQTDQAPVPEEKQTASVNRRRGKTYLIWFI